jgi:hypothetical protein
LFLSFLCKNKISKLFNMKNLLNQKDGQEIVDRIHTLTKSTQGRWGKMDVAQMLTHCQRPLELAFKNPKPARTLMGRIIGPLFRDDVFGPKPYKKNGYTLPPFKITGAQDFALNKEKLLALIEGFPTEMPKAGLVHSFFGPMPVEQWGKGAYKHLDYHLWQLGV